MTKKKEVKENKTLLITILVIILLFAVFFLTRIFYKPLPLTLDEIHERTLLGDESENNFLYNGYSFVKLEGLWYTRVQVGNKLYNIPLHFNPREVEDVPIYGDVRKYLAIVHDNYNRTAYITFDPEETELQYIALANGEFSVNVAKTINLNLIASCTKNITDACSKVPIVTCNSTKKPVIFFDPNEEARVVIKGNCLIFQGEGKELTKAVDRVLMNWYDIVR